MAFPTGHNAPTGFVAGQLKDGSSFGTIDTGAYNGQPGKFKVDLRYYKSTLVALVGFYKQDGVTVVEQPTIKPAKYLLNIIDLALPNTVPTLKTLSTLVADEAKLASIGLTANQLVPTLATGEPIPFQLTADGKVEAFTSAADLAKAQQAAADKQSAALTTLTNSLTGNTTPAGTTPATTGSVLTNMTTTTKVIIGVVVAVVIAGIVYLATKKKKPGRSSGK